VSDSADEDLVQRSHCHAWRCGLPVGGQHVLGPMLDLRLLWGFNVNPGSGWSRLSGMANATRRAISRSDVSVPRGLEPGKLFGNGVQRVGGFVRSGGGPLIPWNDHHSR